MNFRATIRNEKIQLSLQIEATNFAQAYNKVERMLEDRPGFRCVELREVRRAGWAR